MSRPLSAEAPPCIDALASLPLFHKLAGRRVVVAGATRGAVWKAELLGATGAEVTVLAGDAAGAEIFAPLTARFAGSLTVLARPWRASDLSGAALAVAGLEAAEAAIFSDAARAAGVTVNLVDRPELSDVQFGAIINRSPLVIGISTDGGAPVFAQAVRARLEALLPRRLSAWAEAARRWRPALQRRSLPFGQRRRFWERFAALALGEAERAPSEADREALFRTLSPQPSEASGCAGPSGAPVLLVGAGPGDPELLTLKALRALQSADVLFYDASLPASILMLARREARRVAIGAGQCAEEQVGQEMAALAQRGERVVRLASGEGLMTETERATLRRAGIAIERVPGLAPARSGSFEVLTAEDLRAA